MEQNMEKSINQFNKYVQNYDLSNEMISRKYYHTFRVSEYSKELAKNENLNEHDSYIAFICALLHDIGRFKQATEFNTYIDLKSFDHGDMGYEILLKNDYISNYVTDETDKAIVLKAVKNHNKYSIDSSLNEKEMFFAKLVRDADKLDILDKQRNEIKDNIYEIDPVAIDLLKQKKLYKRDGITRNDATEMLLSISFIFDLNFKKSFEIIYNKKIIERKFVVLKEHFSDNYINKLQSIIYEYINDKIK